MQYTRNIKGEIMTNCVRTLMLRGYSRREAEARCKQAKANAIANGTYREDDDDFLINLAFTLVLTSVLDTETYEETPYDSEDSGSSYGSGSSYDSGDSSSYD